MPCQALEVVMFYKLLHLSNVNVNQLRVLIAKFVFIATILISRKI
ncbi:hypothetical protein PsalN5692_01075 [Piscirickettsia salmonis]|nr:hypothetical protein PsalN5692_01075 [Piscirickettsia salmonis]